MEWGHRWYLCGGITRRLGAGVLALVATATIFGMQAGRAWAGDPASVNATLTAPSTVEDGTSVPVAWETSSPTMFDWIGVYRPGAADTAYVRWFYTSTCMGSIGTAKASGSCSLSMPGIGTWELRLFGNGGFTRVATSGPVNVVDTIAPVFKEITASPVVTYPASEEVISWTTNEWTDGQVEYGPTASYGSTTTLDTHRNPTHEQYLNGLAYNTLYHYRVKSKDASGNLAVSPDATFTTADPPPGPTISATPATVIPHGSATVTWDHVYAATNADWIGVYKSGAADTDFTKWFYNGTCADFTSTVGSSGGSCPVTMPDTAGTYEFRLFANNGYTRLATSSPVTVAPSGPTLSVPTAAVAVGGSTTVSWQGVASPTSFDWIGLYKPGAADTSPTKWFYTATCALSTGPAKASGSCSLTMPTTAGTYDLRLFRNGGYGRLANSRPVTVVTSLPTLTATPATVTAGGSTTVTWQGVVSPTTKDWIGLYKPGADDTADTKWAYTSSCTETAGLTAKPSGSCSMTMPSAAGTYEIRLYAANGYVLLATSPAITVK